MNACRADDTSWEHALKQAKSPTIDPRVARWARKSRGRLLTWIRILGFAVPGVVSLLMNAVGEEEFPQLVERALLFIGYAGFVLMLFLLSVDVSRRLAWVLSTLDVAVLLFYFLTFMQDLQFLDYSPAYALAIVAAAFVLVVWLNADESDPYRSWYVTALALIANAIFVIVIEIHLRIAIGISILYVLVGLASYQQLRYHRDLIALSVRQERATSNRVRQLAEERRVALEQAQTSSRQLQTQIEREKSINTAITRFVPTEFLNHLDLDTILDISLGDHRYHRMSILFTDIRDFTSLSENLSTAEAFNFINSYFRYVAPVIREHNGFIDKYIGDGIMGLFPGRGSAAVEAAIEFHKRLQEFNEEANPLTTPVRVGLGVHLGDVALGVVGEENRLEGTVISDAVNLASRLEAMTKQFGIQALVSGEVVKDLEEDHTYMFRYIGKIKAKGKHNYSNLHELLTCESDDQRDRKLMTLNMFDHALLRYQEGNMEDALESFERILNENEMDSVAYYYYQRCQTLVKTGLPANWAGVESLREK